MDVPRGNGMLYIRGQSKDYDQWRQMGNMVWKDVLPYFLKSEIQGRGKSDLHNTGGEFRVEDMRLSWEIDAFRDAAAEVGFPKQVTSTKVITKVVVIFKSIRAGVFDGPPPKVF